MKNKFVWIGYNRILHRYEASGALDTEDILAGNYPQFFCLENRKSGSCKFIGEFFHCDVIHFKMESGELKNYMIDLSEQEIILYGNTKMYLSDMLDDTAIKNVVIW